MQEKIELTEIADGLRGYGPGQASADGTDRRIDIKRSGNSWGLSWPFDLAARNWVRAEFLIARGAKRRAQYIEISFRVRAPTRARLQVVYLICRTEDHAFEISFELASRMVFSGGWDTCRFLVKVEKPNSPLEINYFVAFQNDGHLYLEVSDLSCIIHDTLRVADYRAPKMPPFSYEESRPNSKVAIILCIHNSIAVSFACITSILRDLPENVTLVIVDDGSTEEVARLLKSLTHKIPNVITIRDRTGSGYTQAVNRGIGQVLADYYVLLNSDTVVPRGWLSRLIGGFDDGTDCVGIVGPLSNRATLQSVPAIFKETGWADNVEITTDTVEAHDSILRVAADYLALRPIEVKVVNGFCMAVSRQVFEKIGLFDTYFFATGYGEETDFQLRASEAGFSFFVLPNLLVFHHGSSSYEKYDMAAYQDAAYRLVSLKHGVEAVTSAFEFSRDALCSFSGRDTVNTLLSSGRILGIEDFPPFGTSLTTIEDIEVRARVILNFLVPKADLGSSSGDAELGGVERGGPDYNNISVVDLKQES